MIAMAGKRTAGKWFGNVGGDSRNKFMAINTASIGGNGIWLPRDHMVQRHVFAVFAEINFESAITLRGLNIAGNPISDPRLQIAHENFIRVINHTRVRDESPVRSHP